MQAKNHMTKLMKFSWEEQDEQDVGNEETDLRIKNLLSWQNNLSNRQIAADIKEKWANQGISPIYLSSSNKWKRCHGAINSRPRNLRTALEKYFQFQWYSETNPEIFFPIFSETIHTILKIFSQQDLRKVS